MGIRNYAERDDVENAIRFAAGAAQLNNQDISTMIARLHSESAVTAGGFHGESSVCPTVWAGLYVEDTGGGDDPLRRQITRFFSAFDDIMRSDVPRKILKRSTRIRVEEPSPINYV